jgi:hypothetical protein
MLPMGSVGIGMAGTLRPGARAVKMAGARAGLDRWPRGIDGMTGGT